MKQTLLMKSKSLMLTMLFALSLAALIMLSGAASKAEAQGVDYTVEQPWTHVDPGSTNTVIDQIEEDGRLTSGEINATPNATSTASASASAATASPSAPASASATASAAHDQYKKLPDTGGRAAAPANTTEATGLLETNRNSSVLPLVLGSSALLVGGGLLARRFIR